MKRSLLKCIAALCLLPTLTANAQSVTVTNTNNSGPGSFRQAILDAEDGDAILFADAIDGTAITLTTPVVIDKPLIINGNGVTDTMLNGGDASRLLQITTAGSEAVIINDIAFSHAVSAGNGGAISYTGTETSSLMLNNCHIHENSAQNGGGIYSASGSLTLNNCFFSDNEASANGAGIMMAAGTATINAGAITTNSAGGNGGGLWNAANLSINNVPVNGNTAGGNGGGIYNETAGTILMVQGAINNNTATGTAGNGGGIYGAAGSSLTGINSTVSGNTALLTGGGIAHNGSNIILANIQLLNNQVTGVAGKGGGLYNNATGDTTINSGNITGNTAAQQGGGVWNGTGILFLTNLTFDENTAEGDAATDGGGALYNNAGTVNSSSCTYTNNRANGTSGSGGAIFSTAGNVTITDDSTVANSIISGNSANRAGGGIELISGGVIVSGTIITDNDVNGTAGTPNPGNGGGIHTSGNAVVVATDMEITENSAASQGGGIWMGPGVLSLTGVIVENNIAAGSLMTDGGGGIFNSASSVEIHDSFITGNKATGANGSGGGLYTVSNTFNIVNTPLSNNSANRYGGGAEITGGNFGIHGSTIAANDVDGVAGTPNPGNGGGIHNAGTASVIVDNCDVMNNMARQQGGGLWNQGGTMIVTSSRISTNVAKGNTITDGGGGMYCYSGTAVVIISTFFGNVASGTLGRGGALHVNTGTAGLNLNTFSGNAASGSGGAVYNNGTLNMTANTITLNSAVQNGGGIYGNPTTNLKNTIVEGNLASVSGKEVYSNEDWITSNGFNLIGMDETNSFNAANTDQEGTLANPIDAMLLPLADNGGSTPTCALDCPSPAADRGDLADTFADQNGNEVFNGRRDIGAYEAQEICAMGNREFISAKSMVYPNPSVNGKFTLELAAEHANDAIITVYEAASGKLVKKLNIDTMSTDIILPNAATGIYVMQVVSDKATETHKLIVGN